MEFNDCRGAGVLGRAALLALCALAVACSFRIEPAGLGGSCRRQKDCIEGLVCQERVCAEPARLSEARDAGVDAGD